MAFEASLRLQTQTPRAVPQDPDGIASVVESLVPLVIELWLKSLREGTSARVGV